MRPIKFRAWDREWTPACINDGVAIPAMEYFELGLAAYTEDRDIQIDGNDPNVTIMQFTGLKDKNGVEIYESDKVRDDKGLESVVEWDDLMTGWHPFHRSLQPFLRKYEVIGNIYENKELLDGNAG